jgi:hypothetical protein
VETQRIVTVIYAPGLHQFDDPGAFGFGTFGSSYSLLRLFGKQGVVVRSRCLAFKPG